MIFVDSNVPMYLVGADHPNKAEARRRLERAVIDGEALVTNAEVLQEILHRYVAINRAEAITPAFAALLDVVDLVHPIEASDVQSARALVERRIATSARDALHAAVMRRHGVARILTFDERLAALPGIDSYRG